MGWSSRPAFWPACVLLLSLPAFRCQTLNQALGIENGYVVKSGCSGGSCTCTWHAGVSSTGAYSCNDGIDSSMSYIQVEDVEGPWSGSFKRRTSSEYSEYTNCRDHHYFTIDGVLPGGTNAGSPYTSCYCGDDPGTNPCMKGSEPSSYSTFSFTLGAGTHTLRWGYVKDSSLNWHEDKVYIKQVSLPPLSSPNPTTSNPTSNPTTSNPTSNPTSAPTGTPTSSPTPSPTLSELEQLFSDVAGNLTAIVLLADRLAANSTNQQLDEFTANLAVDAVAAAIAIISVPPPLDSADSLEAVLGFTASISGAHGGLPAVQETTNLVLNHSLSVWEAHSSVAISPTVQEAFADGATNLLKVDPCNQLGSVVEAVTGLLVQSQKTDRTGNVDNATKISTDLLTATSVKVGAGEGYRSQDGAVIPPLQNETSYDFHQMEVGGVDKCDIGGLTDQTAEKIVGNIVHIFITGEDGKEIDISKTPLSFFLSPREEFIKCKTQTYQDLVKSGAVTCQFLDTTTQAWSTQGCKSSDGGLDPKTKKQRVKCECNHLTEFSLVLEIAKANKCDNFLEGHALWAFMLAAYPFLSLLALIQVIRIMASGKLRAKCVHFTAHLLIVLLGLLRTGYAAMFFAGQIGDGVVIASVSSVFLPISNGLFLLISLVWLKLGSNFTASNKDPFRSLTKFVTSFSCGNTLAVTFLLVLSLEDYDVKLFGVLIQAFVALVQAIVFGLFGSRLIKKLNKASFKSKYSRKILCYAIGFGVALTGQLACQIVVARSPELTKEEGAFVTIQSLYVTFDLIGCMLVLLILRRAVGSSKPRGAKDGKKKKKNWLKGGKAKSSVYASEVELGKNNKKKIGKRSQSSSGWASTPVKTVQVSSRTDSPQRPYSVGAASVRDINLEDI